MPFREIVNGALYLLRCTAHPDNHAPERQLLDLVECTEEHRHLNGWEAADHLREHGIVRALAEECKAQEHIAPLARRFFDGISAKCRRQLVR